MRSALHHVSVFVSEMDRSIYLFRDILGFEISWRIPKVGGKKLSALLGIPDMVAELTYLRSRSDGVAIELCRLIHPAVDQSQVQFGGPGTVGLSLTVDDLDGLHRRLSEEGWTPFTACTNMRSPEGDAIRLFCLKTEDGLLLELIEQRKNGR